MGPTSKEKERGGKGMKGVGQEMEREGEGKGKESRSTLHQFLPSPLSGYVELVQEKPCSVGLS